VNTWNYLQLNQRKCKHLRLSLSSHGNNINQYDISGSTIELVTHQRDLGIIVSNNLSWSFHYNKICQKAYNALHLIKKSLPDVASVHTKKQLYISLVRSHLSFCSQLWKPQYAKDILCLERVQRRSTKYVLNDYVSDYKARLVSLQLLPISLWLDLHDLLFLVKCLQDRDSNIEIHQYVSFRNTCTRSGSTGRMLTINFTRTSAARHFYFNRIVCLWNSIQSVVPINTSESLYVIKRKLKAFLVSLLSPLRPVKYLYIPLSLSLPQLPWLRAICIIIINFIITPILFCSLV
jgi:hypothetical protein